MSSQKATSLGDRLTWLTTSSAAGPVLEKSWSDWRVAAAFVSVLVGVLALGSSWLMPRGPLTTSEALITMGLSLVVGLVSGLLWRSRWAMLVGPIVYISVYEVVRLGYDGPTVDGVHPGSTYGLIALVLGRGVHGLLALAPFMLGVSFGRVAGWLLRPSHGEPSSRHTFRYRAGTLVGRMGTVLSTVALVGLAVLIARPASTPAIRAADGSVIEGSIAELRSVELGGKKQSLLIRGHDETNPVLLYLAGGPGGTDIGAMRIFGSALEEDFVVVTWDQRGAGKSYPSLDPTSTLTLEQMVSDTIELTEYLRGRFAEEKIYVVGNSWGATLGVLAVQERPGLFHAYVGAGQMVSQTETDRIFYEDTLAYAERTGNNGLRNQLVALGPPPYENLLSYEPVLAHEREWNDYERVPRYESKGEMPSNLFVREYTLLDQLHALPAFLDTFATLYPQLQDIDFRRDATVLNVPVYMIAGVHEARGRAELADEWFEMLDAPSKERIEFQLSGHRPHFEEPDRFVDVMRTVLAETYPMD